MAQSSNAIQVDRLPARVGLESSWVAKGLMLFWLLRIFKPEWILSYYVPSVSFLRAIPTGLLIVLTVGAIVQGRKLKFDRPMMWFAIVMIASTLFTANLALSFPIMRWSIETVLICALYSAYFSTEASIKKLFNVYLVSLVLFGVWGIGGGGKVSAFLPLEDEDSYGPYMAMGVSLAYFIWRAEPTKGMRRLSALSLFFSLAGAIASLARGTFLSLVALFGYIFLRAENKARFIFRSLVVMAIGVFGAVSLAPQFVEVYVGEVQSIFGENYKEGTGNHRFWMWSRALLIFADNPILGAGPGCYGHVVNAYVTQEDAERWNVRTQMYGQHIHNIYFELLSETGASGVIALFALVYVFRKKNLRIRETSRRLVKNLSGNGLAAEARRLQFYALALEGGVFAFLINSFFFNLLYYSWFWDLLILNLLLYQRILIIDAEANRK